MIRYKFNVLDAIKKRGITTYEIRTKKILSESTVAKLRNNDTTITVANIDTICKLLDCQPGDLLEYYEPETNKKSETTQDDDGELTAIDDEEYKKFLYS